jgi:hypothetical protein
MRRARRARLARCNCPSFPWRRSARNSRSSCHGHGLCQG